MRRLSIRLFLVAAVVTLGTVAIVQSRMTGKTKQTAENKKEDDKKGGPPKPIEPGASTKLGSSDKDLFPTSDLGNGGFDAQTVQATSPADQSKGGFNNQAGSGFDKRNQSNFPDTGNNSNAGFGGGSSIGSDQFSNTDTADKNKATNNKATITIDDKTGAGGSGAGGSGGNFSDNTRGAGSGIQLKDTTGQLSDSTKTAAGNGTSGSLDNSNNTINVPRTLDDTDQGNGAGRSLAGSSNGTANSDVDNSQSGQATDETGTITQKLTDQGNQSQNNVTGNTGNKLNKGSDSISGATGQANGGNLPSTSANAQDGVTGTAGARDLNTGRQDNRSGGGGAGTFAGNGATNARQVDPAPKLIGGAAAKAIQLPLSATPGPRELEGTQTPVVSIRKTAPLGVQVDKEATFHIVVRNSGKVATHNVTVVDRVPDKTRFVEASDNAIHRNGTIVWDLGTLQPGEQRKLSVKLVPTGTGNIGSTAQVLFQAKATVRTTSTQPKIKFTHTPLNRRVLAGDDVVFDITIKNEGDGDAQGLTLLEDVPSQLSHPSGPKLDNAIGTVRAGETRRIQLTLKAEKAGKDIVNTLVLKGDSIPDSRSVSRIDVVAPSLSVFVRGPKVRYLKRKGTYTVNIENPGTATAENVQFTAKLPGHLRFVSASQLGKYNPSRHSVSWSLESLPPGQKASAELVLTADRETPPNASVPAIQVTGSADRNLTAKRAEYPVRVESIPELQFTVSDTSDPIAVGDSTTYQIRIRNVGTKTATKVLAVAELPKGITPSEFTGQRQGKIQGQTVQFDQIPSIAPNQEVTLYFKAKAAAIGTGDYLIKVRVRRFGSGTAVTAEESTRVYQDP